MSKDDDSTTTRATLERALIDRVAERVTAAGRRVEPAAVERIVRQVLDRLGPETPGAPAEDPAVLVFVVETSYGERDLSALRSVLGRAAAALSGARLLAAHREPLPRPHGRAEPTRPRPLATSLEMP